MKKISLTLFMACSLLYSDDFSMLLKESLENSSSLKEAKLNIEKVTQKAQISTRFANPTIDASFAKFDDADGYSVGFSQEVPFFSTNSDLKKLATKRIKEANLEYALLYSSFVKNLSFSYSEYKSTKSLYALSNKELKLSHRIYNIAKERFKNGTIPKSSLLQTKLTYNQALQNHRGLKLKLKSSYYDLLLDFSISKELELDCKHTFSLKNQNTYNPAIKLLEVKKEIAKIRSYSDTKAFKSFSFFGEYEREVKEDIYRVGISMPLVLFNQKKQEKKIASLDLSISDFSLTKTKELQDFEKRKLFYQKKLLNEMIKQNQTLINSHNELLSMLESGFKEAKVGLERLLLIKNSLIKTEKNRVLLLTQYEKTTILQNYINGAYDE